MQRSFAEALNRYNWSLRRRRRDTLPPAGEAAMAHPSRTLRMELRKDTDWVRCWATHTAPREATVTPARRTLRMELGENSNRVRSARSSASE